MPDNFPISIGTLRRRLPIVSLPGGDRIAFLNLAGDGELVREAAAQLCERLPTGVDLIVGPESGGVLLAYEMGRLSGLPHLILRKKWKPYMGDPVTATSRSIIAGASQTFYLGGWEVDQLRGRRTAIVDEVVSTGSTLAAAEQVVGEAGAKVVARLAVATEGDRRTGVIALCHLPIFPAKCTARV
jgi:adenine phosphoribosyltransferase